MDRLEERVRLLERQVVTSRAINRAVNVAVALVLLGCVAYVVSNVLGLQKRIESSRGVGGDWVVRAKRLEIMGAASTRPVLVLRADGGGGRVEVMDRDGRPLAGFDGNRGLAVRSADGTRFPE
jgi:hypothetical protein